MEVTNKVENVVTIILDYPVFQSTGLPYRDAVLSKDSKSTSLEVYNGVRAEEDSFGFQISEVNEDEKSSHCVAMCSVFFFCVPTCDCVASGPIVCFADGKSLVFVEKLLVGTNGFDLLLVNACLSFIR